MACSVGESDIESFEVLPDVSGSTQTLDPTASGAKGSPLPSPGASAGANSGMEAAPGAPSDSTMADGSPAGSDNIPTPGGSGSSPPQSPATSCSDGQHNGQESDVDCGGSLCQRCQTGQRCFAHRDCVSQFCAQGLCAVPGCQSNEDCAQLSGPCTQGLCDPLTRSCIKHNAPEGKPCDSGRPCVDHETCRSGACEQGYPRDCSEHGNDCEHGYCDQTLDACTTKSLIFWRENFIGAGPDNTKGWHAQSRYGRTNWRLGKAVASRSCHLGQDPAQDHSLDASNTLLGTIIGGCISNTFLGWDCIYSPTIDLSEAPEDATLRFWRFLHTRKRASMRHRVLARGEDGSYETLFEGFETSVFDTQWMQMSFDLARFRHAEFVLAICMARAEFSRFSPPTAGWSLDDFSIAPKACHVVQ